MKRYHNYTLTLGLGDDASQYEFLRIGTKTEKESVEKELQELRERLANVDELKRRREEIDTELNKVWVEGSEVVRSSRELEAPASDQQRVRE